MKPNILFLVIDSFRNDSLLKKPKSIVTPNLDNLISKGAYFSKTFTSADGTLLSWASIFSANFPFRTGVTLDNKHKLTNNIKNYFQLFKENGYHAYASIPDIKYLYPLASEFENSDHLHDFYFELPNGLGDKIIKNLKSKSMTEPWIYFIDINDLHLPNWPSEEFDIPKYGESRYERTISQIDNWLGKFMECIDLDNTLIIVTGDHGDYVPFIHNDKHKINLEPNKTQKILRSIGKKFPTYLRKKLAFSIIASSTKNQHQSKINSLDLSPYEKRQLLNTRADKHHYLFDEMMNVPLIFCGYGVEHMPQIHRLTRTVDIFPTIADIVGIKNLENIDGQSLVPLLKNTSFDELPVILERDVIISQSKFDVIGIRTSKYKYFRSVLNSNQNVNLFDLNTDVLEENNIAEKNPMVVKEMEELMKNIKNNKKNEPKPLTKEYEEEMKDELRRLGYI